ncbi:MAG: ABC transporter permease [Thermoanaerobaculia bacterium]|nr:ABC transporter permease [Thermoanaerobaculia bacterium]
MSWPIAPSLPSAALELRVACRRLAARPLTSLAVFASLTVGLALVCLVLSVADRLLLRPLPVVDAPEDLVIVERTSSDPRGGNTSLSWPDFEALRRSLHPGSETAAFYPTQLGLSAVSPDDSPDPESAERTPLEVGTTRLRALIHSDGYGETLRVTPTLGRWPRDLPADDQQTAPGLEAALGHDLWLELGGRAEILGRTIRLQGRVATVVGVLPPGFVGTSHLHRPRIFVPISTFERLATGIDGQFAAKRDEKAWLQVIARLGADVGASAGDGLLLRVRDELEAVRPEAWHDRGLAAVPLIERAFGGADRRTALEHHITLLLSALGCAFLVAYANAAGLVAIRASDRDDEWKLRSALGADVKQVRAAASLEGLILGLSALAAAPLCSFLLLPLIRRLRLPQGAQVDVVLDARQLVPMLVLGVLGTFLLAVTPTWTLAFGKRRARPHSASSARQLFVAGQVALAFVALGCAFQLVRTVEAYRQVDSGVSSEASDRLLAIGLDVGAAGHDGAAALDSFQQIDQALQRVAGVEGASLAATLPLLDSGPMVDLTIQAQGADPPPSGEHHAAHHALVGSGFFSTIGRPVLEGRDFALSDDASAPPVLIINRSLATRLWSDRSALGRQMSLVMAEEPHTVVGVVEDGRYATLGEESKPTLYMAHAQSSYSMIAASLATSATVLVRSELPASPRLMRDVRASVARVDPKVPVLSIRPLRSLLEEHFALEQQIRSILVAVAAALLLFCLVGIYGGLSHSFVRQRGELAVRTALGASRRHLLTRLAGPSCRSSILGVLAGVWLVAPASKLLEGLLFGVGTGSPTSWLAAGGVLLGAILLAGFEPVREAMRLETAALLRDE